LLTGLRRIITETPLKEVLPMAGLDHDLESLIIDLSATPLDQLSALDDEAISAVVRRRGGCESSAHAWSNDELVPPEPPGR
jgi:hypothetical protein